jgi:hypothetical protein
MGAKKTQSFGSGMNGQGLNSSVLKKPWGCFLAEESPDMRYEYSPCLNDLEKGSAIAQQIINKNNEA